MRRKTFAIVLVLMWACIMMFPLTFLTKRTEAASSITPVLGWAAPTREMILDNPTETPALVTPASTSTSLPQLALTSATMTELDVKDVMVLAANNSVDLVFAPTAATVSVHSNISFTARSEATFTVSCTQCHDPHGSTNLATIRANVVVRTSPTFVITGPVVFTSTTGVNSFDDGVSPTYSRICATCHNHSSNPGYPMTSHIGGAGHIGGFDYTEQDCATCHPHDADGNPATNDGFMPVRGVCNGCHGAPPPTGAHLAHSNSVVTPTDYGETGTNSSVTEYGFRCGECHPTDVSKHMDGIVEVDLNPAAAPTTSLKAKNDPAAAYTSGTCSNVYCHSGNSVASGAVGLPLANGGSFVLDSHGNLTYDPYTITATRISRNTPAWVGGSISGLCTDCHAFPLTTSAPNVQAGVGDTHQWVDDQGGYANLHAYNMGYSPLSCSICHFGEITATGAWSRNAMDLTTYAPVPIASDINHVNGAVNVNITTAPYVYRTRTGPITVDLSTAVYDPNTTSCGNVGCHLHQNYVVWGTPYRYWISPECDLCHRYSLPPVPLSLRQSALAQSLKGTLGTTSYHDGTPPPPDTACTTCHPQHLSDPTAINLNGLHADFQPANIGWLGLLAVLSVGAIGWLIRRRHQRKA